jgi:hypothetical protein
MDDLKIKMYSFTVDCKEPSDLAKFYSDLIKWDIVFTDEDYACIAPPGTKHGAYPCICFQRNSEYKRLYGRKSLRLNSRWHIWILL